MSAVQPGGGQGSGRRQGSGGKPPSGQGRGRRPPGSAGAPKTGAKGRPAGTTPKGQRRAGGYQARQAAPRRLSATTLIFGTIAVVVVIIVVLVLVKVVSGGKSTTTNAVAPTLTAATPSVVSQVENVPQSVKNEIGAGITGAGYSRPVVKNGQPPLTVDGKPGAIYIGGEFCPFCAMTRWSMIMAFSQFGTFHGLQFTTSSPWDSDPATPTFSFRNATFTSPAIALQATEYEGNDTDGLGTRTVISRLTNQQQALWIKYDGSSPGFPFLTIGNKVLILAPPLDPSVVSGMDQQEVAAQLDNPSSPVAQEIVGLSNELTAGICSALTNHQPASICNAPGTVTAAHAIGLS